MRAALIPIILLAAILAQGVAQAAGLPADDPHVAILNVGMADSHSVRIDIATSGLDPETADAPTVALTAWLDGVPARAALPLIHMPPHFAMTLDLPAGIVRVGGVAVGTFQPVRRFEENLRFPVEVTVTHGPLTATARRTATILLPTIIVPGYLNELGGPDPDVLADFQRHGFTDRGAYPTLFWFTYPSRRIPLEEGGGALAAYARRVVLSATYAAKINVVAYSVGGLLARWDVAYNVDGWGSLINRLALVGVPNEGAVVPYLGAWAPWFLPFSNWGRSPLVHAAIPAFPFWRAGSGQRWSTPPDGGNVLLAQLNARTIPDGIRLYLFYGSHNPQDSAGPRTAAGLTGALPGAALSFGDGDGIVLAASAEGLPINGEPGVPDLAERAVLRVSLGSVYHTHLLTAGADRIAEALLDRFLNMVEEQPPGN